MKRRQTAMGRSGRSWWAATTPASSPTMSWLSTKKSPNPSPSLSLVLGHARGLALGVDRGQSPADAAAADRGRGQASVVHDRGAALFRENDDGRRGVAPDHGHVGGGGRHDGPARESVPGRPKNVPVPGLLRNVPAPDLLIVTDRAPTPTPRRGKSRRKTKEPLRMNLKRGRGRPRKRYPSHCASN